MALPHAPSLTGILAHYADSDEEDEGVSPPPVRVDGEGAPPANAAGGAVSEEEDEEVGGGGLLDRLRRGGAANRQAAEAAAADAEEVEAQPAADEAPVEVDGVELGAREEAQPGEHGGGGDDVGAPAAPRQFVTVPASLMEGVELPPSPEGPVDPELKARTLLLTPLEGA